MTAPETLVELALRCEKAAGPDREIDGAIAAAVGLPHGPDSGWCNSENGDYWTVDECAKPFTASLDAAMMLVPEGLDFGCGSKDATGMAWAWVGQSRGPMSAPDAIASASIPALALCAAALKARAQAKDSK